MTAAEFVSLLTGARNNGERWMARCPAHEDRSPSLSIAEGADGRVLLHCHAGCSVEAIAAAVGVAVSALFADELRSVEGCTLDSLARHTGIARAALESYGLTSDVDQYGTPVVAIPYRDQDGTLLRTKYRKRLCKGPGGEERFYYGAGTGIAPYGLWRLADWRAKGALILAEGESDAWSLWSERMPALAIPGASQARLLHAEHLAGISRLWVARDNDSAGEEFATALDAQVRALGFSEPLRVIVPPRPHKDVCDWRRASGATFRDEAILAIKKAPTLAEMRSPLLWAHQIQPRRVRFALEPYIPKGYLTLLGGKPGMGKTMLACAIIAALTSGAPIGGFSPVAGKCVLFSAEDDPSEVLLPRLRRAGAQLDRVGIFDFDAEDFSLNGDGMKRLEMVIASESPEIVILDPLVTFLSADVDMNQANEVRSVLRPLAMLAKQTGTAVLVIAHVKKGSTAHAIDSVIGSMDFMAAVRSALITYRDPEGAKGGNYGVLAHVKHNLTAPGQGLRYQIRSSLEDALVPELLWLGRSRFTVEQLATSDEDADQIEDASDMLRAELSIARQMPYLRGKAREIGVTDKALNAARRRIGAVMSRHDDGEYWLAPLAPDYEDVL